MKSPENSSPGEAHKLRLTVQDEVADQLLARLTDNQTRQHLPGFLYVFSEQTYTHVVDDLYDGSSQKDLEFRSYKRKVDDYNKHSFRAFEKVALENRTLHLQVHLGHEAASRIMSPPFFDKMESPEMDIYYKVPGEEPIDGLVIDDLKAYLSEHPPKVYDELTIVSRQTALRSIYGRVRERKSSYITL